MKMKKWIILLWLFGVGIPLLGLANPGMDLKKKGLQELRNKYKLASPKASQSEVDAALNQIKLYQLKRVDDTTVTGATLLDPKKVTLQQMRDIAKTVRALAFAASKEGNEAKKDLYLYLDYLFTENIMEGFPKLVYSSYGDVRKVPVDLLSALPVCDDARKGRMIAAVQNLLEADQLALDAEKIREQVNSDYIYNVIPHLFVCAVHHPNEEQAIQNLSEFSSFLSACTQYTPGGKDILKPDGTGFHHKTHYNGYMYSYRTWVEYLGRLKGTPFRIEKEAYYRMRKAVTSLYLMAVRSTSDNNRVFANSLAGRHPFDGLDVSFSQGLFQTLIEVGGDVLGVPYDPELASYYNYFYKTQKYDAPEVNADGFYQFNYSPAGVYRHQNWVAVMRCPTTNLWGAEIYNKTNRFGRYQSHGTLEVMYEGGLSKSGYPDSKMPDGAGWDWNMMPGATTVCFTDWKELMPNGNDTDRFDQKSETTDFAGALAWEDCGLFAAAFDQGDKWGSRRFEPTGLSFCKSVFAIDGLLFSVGTGISAKGAFADGRMTATNLFQSMISKDCKSLVVNGKEMKKDEELAIDSQRSAWIVAPTTTGYFIPKGHDKLSIRYAGQETPSSKGMEAAFGKAVAAKAYLDHGVKPGKSTYQFMVVPATTPEQMKELAKKQEKGQLFEVAVAQDSVHVVKHLPTATLAYALFAPTAHLTSGVLYGSQTELLVMERLDKTGRILNLALCNPNLRPKKEGNNWTPTPTPVSLELKGEWLADAESKDSPVSLEKNSRGNTVLKTVLSEGSPLYVSLKKGK